jgi:hypothetical protein
MSHRPICSTKWSRLPERLAWTPSVGAERPGSAEDLADLGPARQAAATLNEGGIDRVAKPGARNGGCSRADSDRRAHGSPGHRSEGVLCAQQDTAGLRRIRVCSSHRFTAQSPAPCRGAPPGHLDDQGHRRRPRRRGLPSGRRRCGAGGMQSAARGGRCRPDRSHQEIPAAGRHPERAEPHADWTFAVHGRFQPCASPMCARHKAGLGGALCVTRAAQAVSKPRSYFSAPCLRPPVTQRRNTSPFRPNATVL